MIFPSWHEGFGLPVVEAFSMGLPVLSSAGASLPEVGGAAPIYFPPDRPDLLADAMIALENDPAQRAARAEASLARNRHFSWAATAKSVLEFAAQIHQTGSATAPRSPRA
jgi:alpha-1,3-rhamnosyl/mannosyltransferase